MAYSHLPCLVKKITFANSCTHFHKVTELPDALGCPCCMHFIQVSPAHNFTPKQLDASYSLPARSLNIHVGIYAMSSSSRDGVACTPDRVGTPPVWVDIHLEEASNALAEMVGCKRVWAALMIRFRSDPANWRFSNLCHAQMRIYIPNLAGIYNRADLETI